jgi:hypothetical protein
LLLATGCTVAVVDEGTAADEDETTTAQGNVSVERVVALGEGTVGRTHVSARFVRVSGGIDQRTAERVVGSARLEQDAAVGCSWQQAPATATPNAEGSIELLDVGEIVVRAGTRALPLAARAFPDVGDLVSGVVYTSRDHSSELPEASTYSIETSGSPLVEGFSVQVEAPSTPVGVFVSQPSLVRLGIERLPLEAEFTLSTGEELLVGWDAGRPSLGDRIYLDLVAAEQGQQLRCVFEDDGEGVVPAQLNGFAAGAQIDIALHRHRRTMVRRASGVIDEAVVDFDFAVAARAMTNE